MRSGARSSRGSESSDPGSAVVDFVLVGSLLIFFFLALLQLALALHVRNVLIDSAVLGARFGALSGEDAGAGAERARSLIAEELSPGYAGRVSAQIAELDGVTTIEVEVRAPVPVIGLIGVGRGFTVTGHALVESP